MRTDKIIIEENFLTDQEFEEINKKLFNPTYTLQGSNQGNGLTEFLRMELGDEEFFSDYYVKKLESHFNQSYKLQAVFFNGQWPGRDGLLHKDGCDVTAVLFINEWNWEWGGFTQIMTPKNEVAVIPPVKNRLLCFPGNWNHKGYAFTGGSPMRVTLACQLFIDQDGNKTE